MKAIFLLFAAIAQASHLEDLKAIDALKWDNVKFKTKKDCSLDAHPAVSEKFDVYLFQMRTLLEEESAHYPKLETLISGDGVSRIELFNEGKLVDTINIYRWEMPEIRILLEELGLKRDESITWKTKKAEAELASAFMNPGKKGDL